MRKAKEGYKKRLYTHRINFFLHPEQAKKIQEIAEKTGMRNSEVIREAIRLYIENFEKKGEKQ
jgi:predicted DNA-binding protein